MKNRLVYKEKTTGKIIHVRRIDSCDCYIIDPETNREVRVKQSFLRKHYSFQKKASTPKRWDAQKFFLSHKFFKITNKR